MGPALPSTDEDALLATQTDNMPPNSKDEMFETTSLLLRIILAKEENDDNCKEEYNPLKSTMPSNGLRHLPLTKAVQTLSTYEVLHELQVLDEFRRSCTNLYQRVRALFFLYAIHRFHLPERRGLVEKALKKKHKEGGDIANVAGTMMTVVCPKGYAALLDRRFDESIDYFLASVPTSASTIPISPDNCKSKDELNYDDNHIVPKRTSLISDLTFSRMDSCATNMSNRSTHSSFYRYSDASSYLNGENLGASSRKSSIDSAYNRDELLLPSDATSSALAKAYRELAFQTLADQVKSSVRSHPGNEWMFKLSTIDEQPLRFSEELLSGDNGKGCPVLLEKTPVRMDLSHSCWSDIFFLGMDFPEAARVINCSVDLAVQKEGGNNVTPTPPIECKLQLTKTNPGTIKLTSVDLKASVLLTHVSQVFNYGADYLGLLKAGLVACGIVPLGLERLCEKNDTLLKDLLATMMPAEAVCDNGQCPYGLELTTNVHNIPKGSRLAVSTNLLGSIISVGMRATEQTSALTGRLVEPERRLVAARAILGEWLGGSGGGWQDSGGVWPGLKLIHGVYSKNGDPEYGISRGRLLPQHRLLNKEEAPESLLHALEESLVLVHAGMAQNVG